MEIALIVGALLVGVVIGAVGVVVYVVRKIHWTW